MKSLLLTSCDSEVDSLRAKSHFHIRRSIISTAKFHLQTVIAFNGLVKVLIFFITNRNQSHFLQSCEEKTATRYHSNTIRRYLTAPSDYVFPNLVLCSMKLTLSNFREKMVRDKFLYLNSHAGLAHDRYVPTTKSESFLMAGKCCSS